MTTKRKSPNYASGSRITVTTSAQTLTNINWKNNPTLILTNIGTAVVYVNLNGTAATTTLGYPILPNTQQVITIGKEIYSLSVIGSAAGSDLHVMASGEGI